MLPLLVYLSVVFLSQLSTAAKISSPTLNPNRQALVKIATSSSATVSRLPIEADFSVFKEVQQQSVMAEREFDAKTAAQTAEFHAFLDVVKKLVETKGAGINLAKWNKNEVSCPYEAFLSHYKLSADVKKCLSVLRQRQGEFLNRIGLSWAGSKETPRIFVNIEEFNSYVTPGAAARKKDNRGGARVIKKPGEAYTSKRYLKDKFSKSDVGKLLDQIEAALDDLGEAERYGFMGLFLARVEKMRPAGSKDDKTTELIVNNLKEFLVFMGAKKPGSKTHKVQRAINTVVEQSFPRQLIFET